MSQIKQEETQIKTYLYATEEYRKTNLRQKLDLAFNTAHISMASFMATSYLSSQLDKKS